MRTEPLVAESAQSGKDSSRFMSTDHGAVVIDISSDDEEEEQDLGLGGRRDEETDEVVVLDALPAPFVKRLKQSGEFVGGGLVDDDDDCLVLESDPDKPVLVESDQGRGGDDLLIVAEKGQDLQPSIRIRTFASFVLAVLCSGGSGVKQKEILFTSTTTLFLMETSGSLF